ncbi:DUF4325 domain-containing protein [Patescibacteria group bacterium]|nr:DUF4325 domain-containing protein [Patescibacteria group bacterium]
MDIRETILRLAKEKDIISTDDILKALKGRFSRAYVLRFVKKLLDDGELFKSGSTRSAKYALSSKKHKMANVFEKRYRCEGLKEHEVLEKIEKKMFFLREAPEHIQSIFAYAFTEMLNNAIDHSKSENLVVSVEKTGKLIRFQVNDFGIGVFKNVMKKRKLNSPLEAIQDLLKGKTTTMPRAHSGEGIFFTSKVADVFVLDSYGAELRIDNLIDDVFVGELKPSKKGTLVIFEINLEHEGHLDDVFRQYYTDPDDIAFDKTEIRIELYTRGSIYVSRSQAKRVLSGLEKFKTIILDFDNVPTVGQAFVDEIFRVFQLKNPEITIIPENMNEVVRFMVERVERG